MTLGQVDIQAALETVGPIELLILLVVVAALLLMGPSKIPELARGIGRAMGELRRGRQEVEREIQRELAGGQTQIRQTSSPATIISAAKRS